MSRQGVNRGHANEVEWSKSHIGRMEEHINREKLLFEEEEKKAEIGDGYNSLETEHRMSIVSSGCPKLYKIIAKKQRLQNNCRDWDVLL